eukprot:1900676-Amphidinium_carterae.1
MGLRANVPLLWLGHPYIFVRELPKSPQAPCADVKELRFVVLDNKSEVWVDSLEPASHTNHTPSDRDTPC